MVKRLVVLAGLVAIAVPAGAITVSAEPPSPGGQLFTSATAPCSNNTFPLGDCRTHPTGSEMNLNCVEVFGQVMFASGTISPPGAATGPVLYVLASTTAEIGIDFPTSLHGGAWRCEAAKVPMVPASG